MEYVTSCTTAHLEWLLACGQGQWEDTTGALETTVALTACSAKRATAVKPTCGGLDVPQD
jgi:hypothetical protein